MSKEFKNLSQTNNDKIDYLPKSMTKQNYREQ